MDTMVWIRKAVFVTTVAVVILTHYVDTLSTSSPTISVKTTKTVNTTVTPGIATTSIPATTVESNSTSSQTSKSSTNPSATPVTTVPITTTLPTANTQPQIKQCFNYKCDNKNSTTIPCNFTSNDKLNISKAMNCSGSQCYITKVTSTHFIYEAGCSENCVVTSTSNTTKQCCNSDYCNDHLSSASMRSSGIQAVGIQAVMICLFIILNFK